MDWYLRLIYGLPPRKQTDDLNRFQKTFPADEISSHELMSIRMRNWPISERIIHEGWFAEVEPKESNSSLRISCSSENCSLKISGKGLSSVALTDGEIIHLVGGANGNFPTDTSAKDFAKEIFKKLRNGKKNINVEKAMYVDPYLFASCCPKLKHDAKSSEREKNKFFSREYISELNKLCNSNITFCSSFDDCAHQNIGSIIKELSINNIKSMEKELFHDRFLIAKVGRSFTGVQVGTSVHSLGAKRHYLISSMSSSDAKTLWEILKKRLFMT